jgi:anti-sigma regulatory factor (Ser/Thr protein kinase)
LLPPVPESVGVARRQLRTHLSVVPDPCVDDVVLAASEVLTNAIRHGQGPVVLRVWPGPQVLRVEVVDRGPVVPLQPRRPENDAEGGWGLQIVQAVASRWGVDPVEPGPGKAVWFEVEAATG